MVIYPFSSGVVMNDSLFSQYGGQVGDSTIQQRAASFLVAEKRVSNYLGTLLIPTTVTGTYPYNNNNFIITDYGYVHSIASAKLLSVNNLQNCTLSSDDGCVFIFEDTFGYLNFSCVQNQCNCTGWKQPYQYQIVYNAGLPVGMAIQPDVLMALTIVSQEFLNEVAYPNSDGARGIESWSSLNYSEKRKPLKRTALGQSARANYAAELLDNSVKRAIPYIGL